MSYEISANSFLQVIEKGLVRALNHHKFGAEIENPIFKMNGHYNLQKYVRRYLVRGLHIKSLRFLVYQKKTIIKSI